MKSVSAWFRNPALRGKLGTSADASVKSVPPGAAGALRVAAFPVGEVGPQLLPPQEEFAIALEPSDQRFRELEQPFVGDGHGLIGRTAVHCCEKGE